MIIIGLCGKAGSGKSTFAKRLQENYSQLTDNTKGLWIIPFAESLKKLALHIGWDGQKDERGRRILQILGTDICRNLIDKNYWIEKWDKEVNFAAANGAKIIVADDVRFENEVEHIYKIDGNIYKVVGRSYKDTPTHESEKDLNVVECIENDSTINALDVKARQMIKEIINWAY